VDQQRELHQAVAVAIEQAHALMRAVFDAMTRTLVAAERLHQAQTPEQKRAAWLEFEACHTRERALQQEQWAALQRQGAALERLADALRSEMDDQVRGCR
jgi:hypothetical protein